VQLACITCGKPALNPGEKGASGGGPGGGDGAAGGGEFGNGVTGGGRGGGGEGGGGGCGGDAGAVQRRKSCEYRESGVWDLVIGLGLGVGMRNGY
jgi:hypothetical protein